MSKREGARTTSPEERHSNRSRVWPALRPFCVAVGASLANPHPPAKTPLGSCSQEAAGLGAENRGEAKLEGGWGRAPHFLPTALPKGRVPA